MLDILSNRIAHNVTAVGEGSILDYVLAALANRVLWVGLLPVKKYLDCTKEIYVNNNKVHN